MEEQKKIGSVLKVNANYLCFSNSICCETANKIKTIKLLFKKKRLSRLLDLDCSSSYDKDNYCILTSHSFF